MSIGAALQDSGVDGLAILPRPTRLYTSRCMTAVAKEKGSWGCCQSNRCSRMAILSTAGTSSRLEGQNMSREKSGSKLHTLLFV